MPPPNENEISVNGFGKFKAKAMLAREGRNPPTGETIQFKAAKKLASVRPKPSKTA